MLLRACPPGTGKSALSRVLVDLAVASGRKVLVTATSATAANRLGFTQSDTIDATCQLRPGTHFASLMPNHTGTMALRMADIVLCDEFSMMDKEKLSRVMSKMAQATRKGAPRKVLVSMLLAVLQLLCAVCADAEAASWARVTSLPGLALMAW
jgi:putative N-acetylmannosamine-6-phosphate epimerase